MHEICFKKILKRSAKRIFRVGRILYCTLETSIGGNPGDRMEPYHDENMKFLRCSTSISFLTAVDSDAVPDASKLKSDCKIRIRIYRS